MLTRLDRIQVASLDRREAIAAWGGLLGAELVSEDSVKSLVAERSVLRVGSSEVEILEPSGLGPLADHVSRFRAGLFAVGFATSDLDGLRSQLDARGIHHLADGQQLFLRHDWLDVPGLHVVISRDEEREARGLLSHLYEVTHLCHDYAASAARLAEVFRLDAAHFVPIRSEAYGYEGTLTLFHPNRLDRVESVTPFDRSKTMGRFFAKRGPCLYMAYGETDDPAAIRERLRQHAPKHWTGPAGSAAPDNLFIHPKALGNVMLGVSRTSFAWTWSGRPERVKTNAASASAGGLGSS